jgi:hypothetical protein
MKGMVTTFEGVKVTEQLPDNRSQLVEENVPAILE